MGRDGLDSYIIRGGEKGRARLSVLAGVLAPKTGQLLDQFGSLSGQTVIDVGCGGGDVSFELATRVGPDGKVHGLDLDEEKLAIVRAEAEERGIAHLSFHSADVAKPWPVGDAQLVYARFILTHVTEPAAILRQAFKALDAGGTIVVEDIDMGGYFCDPPCRAFDRSRELYIEAGRRRGADPFIGRRLWRLLREAGFGDVETALHQPFGQSGDAKRMASLTFAAIADSVVETGLATRKDVAEILAELDVFTDRPDTTISMPRIFQAWGIRPLR